MAGDAEVFPLVTKYGRTSLGRFCCLHLGFILLKLKKLINRDRIYRFKLIKKIIIIIIKLLLFKVKQMIKKNDNQYTIIIFD